MTYHVGDTLPALEQVDPETARELRKMLDRIGWSVDDDPMVPVSAVELASRDA